MRRYEPPASTRSRYVTPAPGAADGGRRGARAAGLGVRVIAVDEAAGDRLGVAARRPPARRCRRRHRGGGAAAAAHRPGDADDRLRRRPHRRPGPAGARRRAQRAGRLGALRPQAGPGGAHRRRRRSRRRRRRSTTPRSVPRRATAEDVRRNIVSAGLTPVERDGTLGTAVAMSAPRPGQRGLVPERAAAGPRARAAPRSLHGRVRPAVGVCRPSPRRRRRSRADSRDRIPPRRLPAGPRHGDRVRRSDPVGGGVHHRGRSAGCGASPSTPARGRRRR